MTTPENGASRESPRRNDQAPSVHVLALFSTDDGVCSGLRMLNPTFEAADRELVLLEEEVVGGLKFRPSDFADLAAEMLQAVDDVVPVREMDTVVRAEIDRDLPALREAVELLTGPPYAVLEYAFAGKTFSIKTERDHLLSELAGMENTPNLFKVSLRLDFLGFSLVRVLITILKNGLALPDRVAQMVREKVSLFADRDVPRVWAQIKRAFSIGRGVSNFSVDSPVLPKGFLEVTTIAEMRKNIAGYVLQIRPLLIAERLVTQPTQSYPVSAPDLSYVLTAKNIERVTLAQRQFLRSLSNLLRGWADAERELLDAVGLDEWSWVARSARMWEGTEIDDDDDGGDARSLARTRVRSLRRILMYADLFSVRHSPLESALFGYRLGHEVSSADIRKRARSKPEIQLQRELARFLLERGHFAVGTKFGRAETDLLVAEGGDVVVIEAKKYTRPPTESSLAANLAQLQVYVASQKIPSSRGVLLVFNFSDRFIAAPRSWIRHQFYILPINLGRLTASETRATLTIGEATGTSLICGVLNSAASPRVPRRAVARVGKR